MSKQAQPPVIRLRGVRHNNLKNFDLDLPLHRLIVITGLSGSGKSSLAFDTLFAEGQRRYIETFSPYARQFFDRMDKPQVDSIEGIPPAIAIEQRNAVRTTRSTVGTMTEICDYMKLLWPHLAQLHCRKCGRPVRKDSPQSIWETLFDSEFGVRSSELLITFDLPLSEKLPLEESLALVEKQGYQRLLLPVVGYEQPSDAGLMLREPVNDALLKVSGDSARGTFQIARIEEAAERLRALKPASVTIVQDRVALSKGNRARFVEACEQAYHFGKGKLAIYTFHEPRPLTPDGREGAHKAGEGDNERSIADRALRTTHRFSNHLHCAECDLEYREPTSALFSFNHPIGACPACRGFGRIISIDYGLAMPDFTRTLTQGVVKPWLTGQGAECQDDLMKFCRKRKVPTDVPFEQMPRELQEWVINGDPDYGKDDRHCWPYAWYGVKGYFRWLESKAYKMHVRVLLSRYRAYTPCPDCGGKRFQPEALLYRMAMEYWPLAIGKDQPNASDASSIASRQPSMTLADFYALPIRDALKLVETVATSRHLQTAGSSSPFSASSDPLVLALNEVRSRLGYLAEVGLGYLTLDRPTRSLSGGETERVNLTTCLGTRLVNTLFVLDEPSVGLHPRDTDRLVRILERLRDAGNTVVVVEHEAGVIRAADAVVDLGPEQGERGGEVVFQGTFQELLKDGRSLTGQYLSGRKQIEIPQRRPVSVASNASSRLASTSGAKTPSHVRTNTATLKVDHATRHNLKGLTVQVPLGRFVCITGVSGSGKTTLVREVLLPALEAKLKSQRVDSPVPKASERMNDGEGEDDSDSSINPQQSTLLTGWESLDRVVLVDQSALGKTPRSNPAVYVGAFDSIRELFAQSEPARQRGLNASAFSFNSLQGQCERCRGAGFEKIEMQFLSDVFIRCPDCDGRRYRPHILEVRVSSSGSGGRIQESGVRSQVVAVRDRASRTMEKAWHIADLLDATVNEVIDFLTGFADSRPAERAIQSLKLLQDVGLGYLRLGQPINTLSGGECQRLKLVRHLADGQTCFRHPAGSPDQTCQSDAGSTLFLFDEPTTGLHFDDVRVLLAVFQRLVEAGHSVVVIEHNIEVSKCADWLIDLGPDAGDEGGEVVAQGTPEQVAICDRSHTGRALRAVLHGARAAQSEKRS